MAQCKLGITVPQGIVPCGRCMACRINKGRQWTARILMEWDCHPQRSYFVTLTYNDEHIPEKGSLDKKGTLQWLKDTQKRKTGRLRYYLVGEYGDDSFRPHYHMAIFPRDDEQVRDFLAAWDKGFTQIAEITPQRARYLANYTAKKLTKGDDPRLDGREPEFRSSSRNPPLGAEMVDRIAAAWREPKMREMLEKRGDVEPVFRLQGKIYPIGDWALRRLRSKLGIPLTEAERAAACPTYYEYEHGESAIYDPEAHKAWHDRTKLKKRQGRYRSGPKI